MYKFYHSGRSHFAEIQDLSTVIFRLGINEPARFLKVSTWDINVVYELGFIKQAKAPMERSAFCKIAVI